MNWSSIDLAILLPAFAAGVLVLATHVPLGEYVQPVAARKNITGFFVTNGNLYWNLKKN